MSNYQTIDPTGLAASFRALGNPQRLRLFLRLATCCRQGEICCDADSERRCVGEVGEDLGVSASTVSHHLKVLREAGWIAGERRGTWIWYSLRPEAVARFAELAAQFVPGPSRPADALGSTADRLSVIHPA